jgi:hypothetical protein
MIKQMLNFNYLSFNKGSCKYDTWNSESFKTCVVLYEEILKGRYFDYNLTAI